VATGYEPNIEGAIAVLVDLMLAEGVTMAREPYAPNYRGLVDALIDLKEGFPTRVASRLIIPMEAGENITQGEALYIDSPTGKVFKAIASLGEDEATVIGFANETKLSGGALDVLVGGVLGTSGLSPGELYFLSAASAGAITTTPPSTAGQYVTRVGEAGTANQLAVNPDPPILLS